MFRLYLEEQLAGAWGLSTAGTAVRVGDLGTRRQSGQTGPTGLDTGLARLEEMPDCAGLPNCHSRACWPCRSLLFVPDWPRRHTGPDWRKRKIGQIDPARLTPDCLRVPRRWTRDDFRKAQLRAGRR